MDSTPFPPVLPPTLKTTIPSYLYEQYNDDDNLQAFVDAYNALAQEYVDWFNQIGLPVYTGPLIVGTLLDWIAAGLYGIERPVLVNAPIITKGPYNTFAYNTLPYNTQKRIFPTAVFETSDDTFKRVITWDFFKGDGTVFNIRWLKRRVMRFLFGPSGVNYNVDQTYRVSIGFGPGDQVNIRIVSGTVVITSGSIYNRVAHNRGAYNKLSGNYTPFPVIPEAIILQYAIESGVIDLPFQFTWVVTIV